MDASYIGYFPELQEKPKEEQLRLISEARYVAFHELGLSGKAAATIVLGILLGFVISEACRGRTSATC